MVPGAERGGRLYDAGADEGFGNRACSHGSHIRSGTVAFDSKSEDLDAFMERQEWDKANFERGAVSFSIMNVQAYTIAVVKPAEGQAETVKQYFADYKARTEKDFERYLEDQYEIAKSAVIDEKDGYVIFVMDEDADSIAETIKSKI